VVFELLPESLERCTRDQAAWALMLGLIAMLWMTSMLGV
jgi:hypothetical protein